MPFVFHLAYSKFPSHFATTKTSTFELMKSLFELSYFE